MATPLPGTQTPFGRFVEVSPGQFAFSTPLGVYAPTPGGGFQGFVQSPQGQWTAATPAPAAPAAPAGGGTTGGGTEPVKCEPPFVYDEETQSCKLPSEIAAREQARRDADQKIREAEAKQREAEEKARVADQRALESRSDLRESAKSIIANLLENYGLGNLTDFVNELITKEDIISADVVLGRIRQTDQYKKRFAANAARRAAGYNAISEAEYVNLENSYRQLMRSSGLPQGFYDQAEDFTNLISGDVSVAELSNRINEGYLAVQQANPQVITEMRRLYGVDDSKLAAYFLDPTKATPILLRQAQAAQIAGEATLQAQRELTAVQAEQLAVAGVSPEQARQGFQTIAQAEELFVPLPGTTEQAITQEEQIAGVFGTQSAAQQRLRQRSRERAAAFEAGGRFAGQGTTVTGLQ